MALIRCPECGREISSAAKACPFCGFPLQDGQVEILFAVSSKVSGICIFHANRGSRRDAIIWEGRAGDTARFSVSGPTNIEVSYYASSDYRNHTKYYYGFLAAEGQYLVRAGERYVAFTSEPRTRYYYDVDDCRTEEYRYSISLRKQP